MLAILFRLQYVKCCDKYLMKAISMPQGTVNERWITARYWWYNNGDSGMAWTLLHYWPFVLGIQQLQVDSQHKGSAMMCFDYCLVVYLDKFWTSSSVASEMRHQYSGDVTLMIKDNAWIRVANYVCLLQSVLFWCSFLDYNLMKKC